MALVTRAGPSPTSLRSPSIKQDDLQRPRRGLSLPLGRIYFSLMGYHASPSLLISSSPGWFALPSSPPSSSGDAPCVKVAACYWPNKTVKGTSYAGRRTGSGLGPEGLNWPMWGFPGSHLALAGEENLESEYRPLSEKSE